MTMKEVENELTCSQY